MKSVFGLSLLAASASAFAPQQQRASAQSALKAFEGEIGATPINGEMVCWDPLGFCTDQASFDKFRSLELKHGRVASTFCFSVSLHRIDWWRWIVYLDLVRTSHLTQLPASPFLYLKCLPFGIRQYLGNHLPFPWLCRFPRWPQGCLGNPSR